MEQLELKNGTRLDILNLTKPFIRFEGAERESIRVGLEYNQNADEIYALLTEQNCSEIKHYAEGALAEIFTDYCILSSFRMVTETDVYSGAETPVIQITLARLTYLEKKLR